MKLDRKTTLLVSLLGLIALTGCIEQTTVFNRDACMKLNEKYGSFSGTVCADELLESFSTEFSQVQSAGHADWVANIRDIAIRNGYLSYSCDSGQLEKGAELSEAGSCSSSEPCTQVGNEAICKETGITVLTLEELLDAWDSPGHAMPLERANLFCKNMGGESGSTQIPQTDGTFKYEYWTKASFCDSRSGKENSLVTVTCTNSNQPNPDRSGYEKHVSVSYTDCSGSACETVPPSKAVCSENAEQAEPCMENGTTGPNALKIRLEWNPEKIDYQTCEKWFCDPAQATWSLLDRLHRIEKAYNETGSLEDSRVQELAHFNMNLLQGSFSKPFFQSFADYHENFSSFNPSWFSDWKTYLSSESIEWPVLPAEIAGHYNSDTESVPRIGFFWVDSTDSAGNFHPLENAKTIAPKNGNPVLLSAGEYWDIAKSGTYSLTLSIRFENQNKDFFEERDGKKVPAAIITVLPMISDDSSRTVYVEPVPYPQLYGFFSLNGPFGVMTGFAPEFYPEYVTVTDLQQIAFTPTLNSQAFFEKTEEGKSTYEGPVNYLTPKTDFFSQSDKGAILKKGGSNGIYFFPSSIQTLLAGTSAKGMIFNIPSQSGIIQERLVASAPSCDSEAPTYENTQHIQDLYDAYQHSSGINARWTLESYGEARDLYEEAILDRLNAGCQTLPNKNEEQNSREIRWRAQPGFVLGMIIQNYENVARLASCAPGQQFLAQSQKIQQELQLLDLSSEYRASTAEDVLRLVQHGIACVKRTEIHSVVHGGPNAGAPYTEEFESIVWNTDFFEQKENELFEQWLDAVQQAIPTVQACIPIEKFATTPPFTENNPQQHYLQEGQLTKATAQLQQTAEEIPTGHTTLETVQNIIGWWKNAQTNEPCPYEKRTRSASDIVESRCSTGCTDNAEVFAALSRIKGVSATVVEAVKKSWIEYMITNQCWKKPILGHFFSEVYNSETNQWIIVDPTNPERVPAAVSGTVIIGPNPDNQGAEYIKIARGLDTKDYQYQDTEQKVRELYGLQNYPDCLE
jgi:hypothetical protein